MKGGMTPRTLGLAWLQIERTRTETLRITGIINQQIRWVAPWTETINFELERQMKSHPCSKGIRIYMHYPIKEQTQGLVKLRNFIISLSFFHTSWEMHPKNCSTCRFFPACDNDSRNACSRYRKYSRQKRYWQGAAVQEPKQVPSCNTLVVGLDFSSSCSRRDTPGDPEHRFSDVYRLSHKVLRLHRLNIANWYFFHFNWAQLLCDDNSLQTLKS